MRKLMCAWVTLLLSALAAGPAVGAELPASLPVSRLLLTGSTTMAPLMREVAKRYQSLHPGVQIEVQMGGSGRGLSDVRQGKADIGMVSRALGEAERDVHGLPIARDGVAVVIHASNPVKALNERQLLDIFSGKVSNWRQVGGRDAPLHVIAGAPESATSELFVHFLQISFEQIKAMRHVPVSTERLRAAAGDPDAIIYASVGEAERLAQAGTPIKLLAAGGVAASSRNVRRADYPLSRPLSLVTRGVPTGAARDFMEFCVSSRITDQILAFDFVPYLD